jgi:hypothetical protein
MLLYFISTVYEINLKYILEIFMLRAAREMAKILAEPYKNMVVTYTDKSGKVIKSEQRYTDEYKKCVLCNKKFSKLTKSYIGYTVFTNISPQKENITLTQVFEQSEITDRYELKISLDHNQSAVLCNTCATRMRKQFVRDIGLNNLTRTYAKSNFKEGFFNSLII